jgi:hypothetical protein
MLRLFEREREKKSEEVNATNTVGGGRDILEKKEAWKAKPQMKKKMDRQLIESHPLVWDRLFFFS